MLRKGDILKGIDGSENIVRQLTFQNSEITVYNITVESLHNYFVGEMQILVHNK